MSRPLEFRAWDGEKMHYDDSNLTTPYHIGVFGDFDRNELGLEFMQYTGLKDKNGVKIWEGDIVEYMTSGILWGRFLVKWDDMGFWDCGISDDNQEVIGNIYEHGELLTGDGDN